MKTGDRLKLADWLDAQIKRLEAMPHAAVIADQIERLKRTAEEQREIVRGAE